MDNPDGGNYITFRTALEFNPRSYDGYNIATNKFVPFERPLLIGSLEQLHASVKVAFSPYQKLRQLNAMLSTVIQKPGETVIEYGIRVSKIIKQIIEAIEQLNPPEVAYGMVRSARETALENFVRGLDAELEIKVRLQKPVSLQDAINVAQ